MGLCQKYNTDKSPTTADFSIKQIPHKIDWVHPKNVPTSGRQSMKNLKKIHVSKTSV